MKLVNLYLLRPRVMLKPLMAVRECENFVETYTAGIFLALVILNRFMRHIQRQFI
jgi:hypothetical protein